MKLTSSTRGPADSAACAWLADEPRSTRTNQHQPGHPLRATLCDRCSDARMLGFFVARNGVRSPLSPPLKRLLRRPLTVSEVALRELRSVPQTARRSQSAVQSPSMIISARTSCISSSASAISIHLALRASLRARPWIDVSTVRFRCACQNAAVISATNASV